jgi:hypothetical protein
MSDEAKASTKAEKSTPQPATAPAATEKRSPREWALALGHGPKPKRPQLVDEGTVQMLSSLLGSAKHEAAKALHGWDDHEHNEGAPIELTSEDYLAALAASHPVDVYLKKGTKDERTPDAEEAARDRWGNPVLHPKFDGTPKPHPGALSKHKGNKVRVGKDGREYRIGEKAN